MTREEAKALLESRRDLIKSDYPEIDDYREALDMAIKALEQQPCEDTISRADVEQTVEDNILCYTHSDRPIDQDPDTECDMAIRMALRMLRKDLRKLPSAQPEPLTDKEQRIFLAAMGREEKVCRQVDEECRDCREPYEDSLVRVCQEITRKVKGALWT